MIKQRILVVGDDAGLRATLARWLIGAGYSVELAESARHARRVLAHERIGLAIVAPEQLDGNDLASELRAVVDRLIVVTAPAGDSSLPTAPAVRADGYLSKPLREDDVLARIGAALRADADTVEAPPELLHFAGYTVDVAGRRCLDAGGRILALTPAELTLLIYLARRLGRAASRDHLTRAVAGRSAERGDRSVDVLISRLRRKIEVNPKSPQMILTVPGVGYKLVARPIDTAPTASKPAVPAAETTDTAVSWAPTAATPAANAPDSPPRRSSIGAKTLANVGRLASVLLRTLRPRASSRLV